MAITERYVNSAGSGSADGSSEANAMSYATFLDYMITGGSFTAAAGDRFNIIQDTYARTTTTDTWVNGGTATSPVIIRGYKTTITDGYQGRTNGSGPLVTTNMPSITYTTGRLTITGNFIILESLNITGAPSNSTVSLTAANYLVHCVVANTGTNASSEAVFCGSSGAPAACFDCDMTFSGASGGRGAVSLGNNASSLIGCRIKGGVIRGVRVASNVHSLIEGCVIYGSTNGIETLATSAGMTVRNCTIVGNSNDGINIITGTTVSQVLIGNLITDNTQYGINGVAAGNAIFAAYNRLDRNGTATNLATDWLAATSYGHNTTSATQANEYESYAGNDFRLKSTSPAKGAGFFPYMDLGAIQRQESGGTGSIFSTPVIRAA